VYCQIIQLSSNEELENNTGVCFGGLTSYFPR